jgi:hypothetical protein
MCMCIYMFICMYTQINVYTIYIHIHKHIYTHVYINIQWYICTENLCTHFETSLKCYSAIYYLLFAIYYPLSTIYYLSPSRIRLAKSTF